MHWLSWLAQTGGAQGIILALAIVGIPYGNRRANRVLAAFLVAESLRLFALSYYHPGATVIPLLPVAMFMNLGYALGPLLYFYVRLLVDPGYRLGHRNWLHFLPVLAATALFWPGGLLVPVEAREYAGFDNLPHEVRSRISLVTIPFFISLGVYSALALRYLQQHRQSIKHQFSSLEHINLRWLWVLVLLCLVIASASAVVELLRGLLLAEFGPRVITTVVTSVALIYYIGLMGIRQPIIFDQAERYRGLQAAPSAAEQIAAPKPKYRKSGLTDADIDRLWQKLEASMAQDKPYTEPGIKLAVLASKLGTRPDYLSQAINIRSGANFYDYVNGYRVRAAQAMLESSDDDRTIADIATAAGFSSLNIFNKHFKRIVGMTPSNYRKIPRKTGTPTG